MRDRPAAWFGPGELERPQLDQCLHVIGDASERHAKLVRDRNRGARLAIERGEDRRPKRMRHGLDGVVGLDLGHIDCIGGAVRTLDLGATCVRMTSQGGPYARFQRALAAGNLLQVRAAAAELPQAPPLPDALRICLLLRDAEPEAFERAVVRWLGRFCLERPNATLADVLDAGRPVATL